MQKKLIFNVSAQYDNFQPKTQSNCQSTLTTKTEETEKTEVPTVRAN